MNGENIYRLRLGEVRPWVEELLMEQSLDNFRDLWYNVGQRGR
jgi:hypothetical protein